MKSKFFLAMLALVPASLATGLDLFDFDVLDALQDTLTSPTCLLFCVFLCVGFFVPTSAQAAANSWSDSGLGGKWEDASKWSLGFAPTNTQSGIFITNTLPVFTVRNVTNDGANATAMTISNLTISTPAAARFNHLVLRNAGTPLRVFNSLIVSNGGILEVTNSTLRVDGVSGGRIVCDGTAALLADGVIIATNSGVDVRIGDIGSGSFQLAGTLLAGNTFVGINAGSQGTLTVAGGTDTLTGPLLIGSGANATGAVWVTGGQLLVSNQDVTLGGSLGNATMAISNGAVQARTLSLGAATSARGTLTVAGGLIELQSSVGNALSVAGGMGSHGTVWLTGGKVVATNAATAIGGAGAGNVTVSNGLLLAQEIRLAASLGEGTLTVLGGTNALTGPLTIGAGGPDGVGTVIVSGGQLVITNRPDLVGAGSGFVIDGSVTLTNTSSLIVVSNAATIIGNRGSGSLTIKAGTVLDSSVRLGENPGASGTLTIAGGTNSAPVGGVIIGFGSNTFGAVWIVGSEARLETVSPNNSSSIFLGESDSIGQLTISNGSVEAASLYAGSGNRSLGTFTIAGGALVLRGALSVGSDLACTGVVWITGGQVTMTNGMGPALSIGVAGVGVLTMSNGLMTSARACTVGAGGQGTVTIAGGTSSIYSNLVIGKFDCTGTGVVNITGGALYVTNAAHNAVLEVRSGTLILNSGTVAVDQFVITNSCAHFVRTGGTLILNPTRDEDGDGIPNGYEQNHGLNPLDPADAALDNDGDGQSNLTEFLEGTDPNNRASAFRFIEISRQGNGIHLTWTAGVGPTNALQRTTGGPGGSYGTNNFTTLATFHASGTPGDVTNSLTELNAATNFPALYYRLIRVP